MTSKARLDVEGCHLSNSLVPNLHFYIGGLAADKLVLLLLLLLLLLLILLLVLQLQVVWHTCQAYTSTAATAACATTSTRLGSLMFDQHDKIDVDQSYSGRKGICGKMYSYHRYVNCSCSTCELLPLSLCSVCLYQMLIWFERKIFAKQ